MSKTEKVIVAGSPELAQALQALHPEVQEVVVGRATPEAVEGKYVIGSLPPHLAERAAVVEALREDPEGRLAQLYREWAGNPTSGRPGRFLPRERSGFPLIRLRG